MAFASSSRFLRSIADSITAAYSCTVHTGKSRGREEPLLYIIGAWTVVRRRVVRPRPRHARMHISLYPSVCMEC